MMTMAPISLAAIEQSLIDARLDTIERMLMGRVPRSDRMAIVHEVESQIYELLGDRDPKTITSGDVLDVLRRMDPPEAYLANEGSESERARPFHPVNLASSSVKPGEWMGREGQIAGFTGLFSIGLILLAPLVWSVAMTLQSEVLLMVGIAVLTLAGIAASILGLALSIRSRRQGILPIVGLITASLALPIWLSAGPLIFLNL